ncbi:MAG: hypothetical protein AAB037_05240, partial [Chloroflexota bacterium]
MVLSKGSPGSFVRALRCRQCHREYPAEAYFVCEYCFASLEVVYDYDGIARTLTRKKIEGRSPNLWRYRELLPVGEETVDLGTGFTPLLKAPNLG